MSATRPLTITLPEEMARAVKARVASGAYASDSEVIREGLRALIAQEHAVERYCVEPGQACGYMLGKLTWLRERQKAKTALGAGFDIRRFHDAGLTCGAVPLDILPKVIDRYIASAKT